MAKWWSKIYPGWLLLPVLGGVLLFALRLFRRGREDVVVKHLDKAFRIREAARNKRLVALYPKQEIYATEITRLTRKRDEELKMLGKQLKKTGVSASEVANRLRDLRL